MEIATAYAAIVESFDAGIYFIDKQEHVIVWNSAAEKITGYLSEEVWDKLYLDNYLDPIGGDGSLLCFNACPIAQTFEDGEIREVEAYIKHKRGHRVSVLMKSIPAYDQGELVGVIVTIIPIGQSSQESLQADSISKLAVVDLFTGLSNRHRLETVINAKCREYKRAGSSFSVVIVGMLFAQDEDTTSEEIDGITLKIADTLDGSIRKDDLAGRWSQNEFVIVFAVDSDEKLQLVSNKIHQSVERAVIDKKSRVAIQIGATMVCGADNAVSIVERARYLSNAAIKS